MLALGNCLDKGTALFSHSSLSLFSSSPHLIDGTYCSTTTKNFVSFIQMSSSSHPLNMMLLFTILSALICIQLVTVASSGM